MKPVVRILPLAAVAVGGVLALKALSGVQALPEMLSPSHAAAAEAPKPPPVKPLPPRPVMSAPRPAPAPVCAPSVADLAKEAGMSPAELQVLQSLGARRGQLDQRERDLDTKIQLLAAAETKVDTKIKSMNALKAEVQGLLGQGDQKTQEQVNQLVLVYSKMKPNAAGAVFDTLDDKVRVPIAAALKPMVLADIMKNMSVVEAKKLTESLAHRYAPQQAMAQAAAAKALAPTDPLAAPPEAAQPDKPAAKPAQQAKTAAKPRIRPRRVANRAAAKPEAVAKAAPAAPAPAAATTPAKPTTQAAAPAAAKPAAPTPAKST